MRPSTITVASPIARLFEGPVAVCRGPDIEDTTAPLIELRAGDDDIASRAILERFGAVDLDCLDHVAVAPGTDADYMVACDGDVHSYCEFSRYVVPQLRDLGWHIEFDDRYPYQVLDSDVPWYADVAEASDRPDWFGLELGVEMAGARVNLLPALLDHLERARGNSLESVSRSARRLAVRVSDTHCVTIPPERVRALLEVLAELYSEGGFSLAHPSILCRLDDAFGPERELRWGGAGRPRDRAARLREAPREPQTVPPGLRATLRPYQRHGLAWLQHIFDLGVGGILADDMGLGKTLQTIAHLSLLKARGLLQRPALVIAPTSLVGGWKREIARFAPHLRTVVVHGPQRGRAWPRAAGANIVITSYPILVRDRERFESLDCTTVILDEAQVIKNQRSQVHVAARALQAQHRLCLTGTPLENNLGELWALFDFAEPGLLGRETSFRALYQTPIERDGSRERLAALRQRVAPYILRRLKSEVAKDLPPKTELLRPVTLRGEQRDLYEAIRVSAHAKVRQAIRERGLAASTVSVLDALMKLRQVCCDPRLVSMESAQAVRRSAKLDALFELVDALLADDHTILVFSQFTSMLALISEGLRLRHVRHVALTGATRHRQQVVDQFQNGGAEVFLISLKAGGTGLTLTAADTIIHFDPWWNPAAQDQATDRAYRIGQTKPVFSYTLFAAGSVEEKILALQRRKRELADAILGGDRAVGSMTLSDVDALFAPLPGDLET